MKKEHPGPRVPLQEPGEGLGPLIPALVAGLLAAAALFSYLSLRLLRSWVRGGVEDEALDAFEAAAGLIFLMLAAMTLLAATAVSSAAP